MINLFVFQGFSYIIPLILIPFLINTLGLDGYGLINFVLALTFFFQVFNEFGFELSNVPHVVSNRHDSKSLSSILSAITFNRFILYLFSTVIYFIIVLSIKDLRDNFMIYLLGNLRIFALAITPIWLFRSLEDMKSLTRIAIPIKILTFTPIFIVVRNKSDVNWVMFFYMLECLSSLIVAYIIIDKKYNVRIIKSRFSDMKYYLKESWPYFTSYILMRLYQNGNAIVLKFCGGDIMVGLYSAAEKLHNAYTGFVSPLLTQVLYPYFTRIKNIYRINRICILVVVINILMVILVYFLSPYLIDYFVKDSPGQITKYFYLFLLGIIVDVPNNLFGYSYLGVIGHVEKVNSSAIYASLFYVLGLILLFVLDTINVASLIILLIAVQTISLGFRLYYIKRFALD